METVPREICNEIAKYLDDKARRLMRLANTKWFDIIHYNYFTLLRAAPVMLPMVVDRLSKYLWPISVRFLHRSEDSLASIIQNIPRLTNLQGLIFDDDLEMESAVDWLKLTTLSNLEQMELGIDIPLELLSYLPNLKTWRIPATKRALAEQIQAAKKFTTLEDLSRVYDPLWLSIIPNPSRLTSLIVDMSDPNLKFNTQEMADLKIHEPNDNIFERLPLLETLQVTNTPFVPNLRSNTNLTHLVLLCPNGDYGSLTALKKLRSIYVRWPVDFDYMTASFFTALTALEFALFYFEPGRTEIGRSLQFLPEKLKRVFISSHAAIDMQFMPKLTDLNTLQINTCKNVSGLDRLTNLTQLTLEISRIVPFIDFSAISQLIKLNKLTIVVPENLTPALEFPNLELLTDLKSIKFSCAFVPPAVANHVFAAKSLQDIKIPIHNDASIDYSALLKMTALKKLDLQDGYTTAEQFWINLAKVTQLEYLALPYIDNDHRLDTLVNLTELRLSTAAAKTFTGETLTKLTALMTLYYGGAQPLTVTRADLRAKLSKLVDVWLPSY